MVTWVILVKLGVYINKMARTREMEWQEGWEGGILEKAKVTVNQNSFNTCIIVSLLN